MKHPKRDKAILIIALCLATIVTVAAIGIGILAVINAIEDANRSSRKSRRSADKDRTSGHTEETIDDDDHETEPSETSSQVDPADMAEWTVLVYMCGTDLETEYGFASMAFDWMDDLESSDDVNVLVETGGTLQWNNNDPYFSGDSVNSVDIPSDALGRFKIEQGSVTDLGSVPLASMGEASTLSDFISWGMAEFPAQKYMLVMWDHGYVEPYGCLEHDEIFYDDGNGNLINSLNDNRAVSGLNNDNLDLDELREALSDGGVHFDMIAFNTCLSASVEIASAVAPYGDYMVASQESIPAIIGLPVEYISYMVSNPTCEAYDIGQQILDLYKNNIDYYESYTGEEGEIFAKGTMSLIDLSCIEELDSNYAEIMKRLYYSTFDMTSYSRFINAAASCENYGSDGNGVGNLIDLRSFLIKSSELLSDTDADENIISLIDNSVTSIAGSGRFESHGLSIFFPSVDYIRGIMGRFEAYGEYYGVQFTDDELTDYCIGYIEDSFDGYVDNIDSLEGYYWYAAYLERRFSEYWTGDDAVHDLVDQNIDPSFTGQEPITQTDDNPIEYEIIYDNGYIGLNITTGADTVVSVESNLSSYFRMDNTDGTSTHNFYIWGSEPVGSDDNGIYVYPSSCHVYFFDDYGVPVFIIEDTDNFTTFAVPSIINDGWQRDTPWTYIVFQRDKATDECEIMYALYSNPYGGVAKNEIYNLQDGDLIAPLRFIYTYSESIAALDFVPDYDGEVYVRPVPDYIVYDSANTVVERFEVSPSDDNSIFLLNFIIKDVFGNIITTERAEITYNGGVVSGVQEAVGYYEYKTMYDYYEQGFEGFATFWASPADDGDDAGDDNDADGGNAAG